MKHNSKREDDLVIKDEKRRRIENSIKIEDIGKQNNIKGSKKTNLSLQTRTSLKLLHTAIHSLSKAQIVCVKEMGFGGLLNMKTDGVPAKLGYYVVNSLTRKKW